MTECEICGVEIEGKAQYVAIGSSKLRVCKACARHGTVVVEDTKTKITFGSERVQLAQAKRRLYDQMDHEIEEGLEIAEDYGRKIKEAREKAGLKQAELAQRINEKQSLLRKIEHEEIIPSDEVRKKIERLLKIAL
ncbi:MAG TPA: multiprotein bridging factor aMBF1 [Candidatus Bathyarchaeia archaeon]|nr:multiprotein bridging factor aMBF1 [Candidatus Bathyarchaeia archaeon]